MKIRNFNPTHIDSDTRRRLMARTVDRMSVEEFTEACARGYEDEAKSMLERNPGLHNMRDTRGYTGLMRALRFEHPTLYRWLLSLPGLDTNVRDEDDTTALHCGCQWGAPLDIVFTLVRLSSWETVNRKDGWGYTALDLALERRNTSAALYLSWLGAECKEENRNCCYTGERSSRVKHTFTAVTLQTWIETGCQQEAQYWAVVANDAQALNQLARMENITMDTENLKALAKQYNHQKIFSVWGELASLTILAWEVCVSSPVLHRPGTAMPELNLASYRDTLHLLCRRAKSQNYNQEEQLLPYGENNSAM